MLQSMESQRVGHNLATEQQTTHMHIFYIHVKKKNIYIYTISPLFIPGANKLNELKQFAQSHRAFCYTVNKVGLLAEKRLNVLTEPQTYIQEVKHKTR